MTVKFEITVIQSILSLELCFIIQKDLKKFYQSYSVDKNWGYH